MGEGTCGEAGHRCRHHGVMPGSSRVKGLICKVVLVELAHNGVPPVREAICQVITTRFCNLVLEWG